jgi:hypothetical protein
MHNSIKHVTLIELFNMAIEDISAVSINFVQHYPIDGPLQVFRELGMIHYLFFPLDLLLGKG